MNLGWIDRARESQAWEMKRSEGAGGAGAARLQLADAADAGIPDEDGRGPLTGKDRQARALTDGVETGMADNRRGMGWVHEPEGDEAQTRLADAVNILPGGVRAVIDNFIDGVQNEGADVFVGPTRGAPNATTIASELPSGATVSVAVYPPGVSPVGGAVDPARLEPGVAAGVDPEHRDNDGGREIPGEDAGWDGQEGFNARGDWAS